MQIIWHFYLATVLATFTKIWAIFPQSSGHPNQPTPTPTPTDTQKHIKIAGSAKMDRFPS